jgi:hypothetical protein
MSKPARKMNKLELWLTYNDTYINDVQSNPRARHAMRNDPGVKFMRHGWWIFWAIVITITTLCKLG